MKIALKCWAKDPKALALYMGTMVVDIVFIVLGVLMVRMLPILFSGEISLETGLIFGGILVGQCITNTIIAYGYRMAKMHLNTFLQKEYGAKMTDAQYRMFTEVSCAKVWSIGEFMWNAASVMDCITNVFTLGIQLIATLFAMATLAGWELIVPIVIVYALFAVIMKPITKRFNEIDDKRKQIFKARTEEMHSIVDSFEIIRVFNSANKHLNALGGLLDDGFNNQKKKSTINSLMRLLVTIVESVGVAITVIYSIWQIGEGNLTAAVAVSLVMYVTKLIEPLSYILNNIDSISENLAYANDYDMIMKYEEIDKDKRKVTLSEFNDNITINNIGFQYNDSANVLNGINMEIKKGQKIGIVGKSGGGKSTLGKLLMRFYDPSEGNIEIDGVDISKITDESYASRVGCVPQETIILPGTIKENILYAKPNALEFELVEATKNANLYDFIQTLPNGFDTDVGPRGLQLSGGQKQRIALARIFLKNPDIILMDEATSALDNESETLVQQAIDRLKDKTIITIAHRLSTIKNNDQIYVIGNHSIIEHGTHDELIKANGVYASMQK